MGKFEFHISECYLKFFGILHVVYFSLVLCYILNVYLLSAGKVIPLNLQDIFVVFYLFIFYQ